MAAPSSKPHGKPVKPEKIESGRYVSVYTHCSSMTDFLTNENYMDTCTIHTRCWVAQSVDTLINTMIELKLSLHHRKGVGRSSEVERSLMVWWAVGSILHGVNPLSYFSFQPVLHDWCNKGRGMCYPVCGMVHIKEPLLLIDKSSLCGGSGFPFSLSEWSLTICLTPYNHR